MLINDEYEIFEHVYMSAMYLADWAEDNPAVHGNTPAEIGQCAKDLFLGEHGAGLIGNMLVCVLECIDAERLGQEILKRR